MRFPSHFLTYFAALLYVAICTPASAQNTYSWNYTGTGWGNSFNWSPNGVPTASDTAILGVFDGTSYTLPSFSAAGQAGQFAIFGPRPFLTEMIIGNGNTLTLGTGGVMSVAPLTDRGAYGHTLQLDNLTVNIANGTSFASGFAQTVGAIELSGFSSRTELRNGSHLRLVNAAGTANYDLTINSGAHLFVNPGTQVTNGIGVNSAGQGKIRFHGGGQLNFQGANATSAGSVTTTHDANQLVAASGHAKVGVFVGSNSGLNTANIRLNLGNGALQRGIDRSTRDPAGNVISLGTGTIEFYFGSDEIPGFNGSQGQLFFRPGSTGVPTMNGVITEGTSNNSNSPFVILTGSIPSRSGFLGRFATIDPGSGAVTAQLGTQLDQNTLTAAAANANVVYQPTSSSANATLSASISPQTIVFEPVTSGQSVDLGGNTLTTPGIIVERTTNGTTPYAFSINNGTIAGPASALRNIFVLGASSNTLFNVGATFGSGGGVVKSGIGTMVLTGNAPQMNFGGGIFINEGAIRARIDGSSANLGTNNTLALRGGVLEVNAGGGTSTFSRSLGNGLGQVNWNFGTSTMVSDRGGGGFAVVSGALDVNIGGASQTLVWNGTVGNNLYFIRSGQSLRLGSFQQNGVLTLQNNLALDDGSAGLPVENREIIAEGLSTTIPLYTQRSRITGVISGSASTSLMKSGPGMLELTGANTYAGGTTVTLGTLLVNNTTGSGTGMGRVVVYGTLLGNGIIAPSSGNGVTIMPNPLGHPSLGLYRDQYAGTPGHLTVGSAGVNNPVTLRAGAISVFQLNGTNFNPAGGSTSYSRLTVRGTGAVTVDGSTLVVGLNNGFTPSGSDVFGILDNQTGNAITGTFAGVAEGGTVNAVFVNNAPAGTFLLTYQGNITESGISISGGNDVVLYNFTPVPEPAAVIGLCGVVVGVAGGVRRVRRRVRRWLFC